MVRINQSVAILELDKTDKIKTRQILDRFFKKWDWDKEIFMTGYRL